MQSLLMGDVDCRRFARHVATHGSFRSDGLLGTFHFFVHWILCTACRQFQREILFLGRTVRRVAHTRFPQETELADLKKRLLKNIKTRFSPPS